MEDGGDRREKLIPNAVLLAGPTASGKSALALALARAENRAIVNADSMQVYAVLEKITARPDPDAVAQARHLLYGHVHPSEAYSVGRWAEEVRGLHTQGAFDGRPPIFVGGTGLYFRALAEGLSTMPEIPEPVRARWRRRLSVEGPAALHSVLTARDRETAASIRPGDGQRLVRALEVWEASGRSIRWWQNQAGRPLIDLASARMIVIEPARDLLHRRIEQRFREMAEAGAREEARAMLDLDLDPAAPALKAIGLRELMQAEQGEITLSDAVGKAVAATRRYAKRQGTWFRHQLDARWLRLPVEDDAAPELLVPALRRTR
jgi:tRNA dimethylallyltransferase